MTRKKFEQLFMSVLETAREKAENILGRSIPGNFQILYNSGSLDALIDLNTALDKIYLGEDKFYRIIDVAVLEVSPQHTRVFVRVSGHPPVPFHETWNYTEGTGPFKQLIGQIQEVDD